MQQTLLALLGLLVITMLSYNQQRANIRDQQQAIEREYGQMALGVAKQTVEAVRARQYFDRALRTKDDPDVEDDFTKETNNQWGGDDCIRQNKFVSNPDGGYDCTAIEDFHDDETMEMENADGLVPAQIPDQIQLFQVEVEVHYVKESSSGLVRRDPSDPPTRLKEVTVRVQDCQDGETADNDLCDGDPILSRPIVFSEVIGYTG